MSVVVNRLDSSIVAEYGDVEGIVIVGVAKIYPLFVDLHSARHTAKTRTTVGREEIIHIPRIGWIVWPCKLRGYELVPSIGYPSSQQHHISDGEARQARARGGTIQEAQEHRPGRLGSRLSSG